METNCEYLEYDSTGYFSGLILDYLQQKEALQSFYKHPVSLQGIKASIAARQEFATPRTLLVNELRKQYAGLNLTAKQEQNLQLLLQEDTFTICTAHQPNIFTGHLYFIYKILHVVKLADQLQQTISDCNFVPVYYMGSEDADLDELGHINLNGEVLTWQTKQTGAVGRMKVDKQLLQLIERISGELSVQQHGPALIDLFKKAYKEGSTIQQATLVLVNDLFATYGLLVLIPDNAALKTAFNQIVQRELTGQFSHKLVEETTKELEQNYKVQASGRELNLFYLADDKRERIELAKEGYVVDALGLTFTATEMLNELEAHPERFSANVILRGVFQEIILPNIAFIGGGGEIAYWLELKRVFEACNVPYPVLIVRNSFMLINKHQANITAQLGFSTTDLFTKETDLINKLVKRDSDKKLNLSEEIAELNIWYKKVQEFANEIDVTLADHTIALQTQAQQKITALEKKMLRAEKRKFEAQQRKIKLLKNILFPQDNLQERVDNFSSFYATYGKEWIEALYQHSLTLEQQFGIIKLP